jgi:hypothetical protein
MCRVVLTAQFTIRATFVYAVTADMTEWHRFDIVTRWKRDWSCITFYGDHSEGDLCALLYLEREK